MTILQPATLSLFLLAAGQKHTVAGANTIEEDDVIIRQHLVDMNDILADRNEAFRIESVALYVDEDHAEMGRQVFASDRGNGQLVHHFVAGDARRAWGDDQGTGITWALDGTSDGAATGGVSAEETQAAIERAMQTWEDVQCSNIPLVNLGVTDFDAGYVQFLLGFGGGPFIIADVFHGGWMPAAFFNAIAPGGANFILGVTFTFTFTASQGTETAFREIYYNNNFPWSTGGGGIDVESIALHEAGHGLSQGHFGEIFRTPGKDGKLHFAPAGVMNAAYTGVRREITARDNGAHCSIWGNWPN